MGELGTAWTQGLQKGDKGKEVQKFVQVAVSPRVPFAVPAHHTLRVCPQVAVTLKHFDANSLEGGSKADGQNTRHNVDANISKYLLADYYWPAFRAPIKRADAKGVMCRYCKGTRGDTG
jgi:beta-glucosidase-like glycosyl hydrolase